MSNDRCPIERALRDAYAAGCATAQERSLFTALQYSEREAPKLRAVLEARALCGEAWRPFETPHPSGVFRLLVEDTVKGTETRIYACTMGYPDGEPCFMVGIGSGFQPLHKSWRVIGWLPLDSDVRITKASEQHKPTTGNWIAADDVNRLVREIDVALNGEDGAAQQASLCDIAAQVKRAAREHAAHGNAALAHISNALDDLDSSPDQRPVPLLQEAMYHIRAMLWGNREPT
jgi:hypothetical protein